MPTRASADIEGKLSLAKARLASVETLMGLSPVGERAADGLEETLHRRQSGWNAVVLRSHASYVAEALHVICPPAKQSLDGKNSTELQKNAVKKQ